MLSAINSASYKSSFEPEGMPREEEEIRTEIRQVEGRIITLLDGFNQKHCIMDPHTLDLVTMFDDMDRMRLELPALCDVLDTLEEELSQAIYEPDYDLMAKGDDL